MSSLSPDLIKQLKDDGLFKQFQEFIIEKIEELELIGDLEGLKNEEAGELVRSRSLAAKKLRELLSPFVDFREKSEPTVEQVQKAKDKHGL